MANENEPLPPDPSTEAEDGEIEIVVAACVSTNVTGGPLFGVTVMVPVRWTASVLPVAVY